MVKQNVINLLNRTYDDLKQEISEARKHGKDSFIAELMFMSLKPMIVIIETGNDEKDIKIANNLIIKIKKELKERYEEDKK